LLAKAGNGVEGPASAGRIPRGYHEIRGEPTPPPPYSPLENNCSASTAGMLAYCVLCGLPKATYLAYDHPLQQAIRGAVAHFTSTAEGELLSGIDGCSAPNYAVPLDRLALAFARLAARHDDAVYGRAPQVLADAMTAHPEMVSGEGRSDLALMRAGRGDWVAKIGAEGVRGSGVRGAGIGIAIKVPTATSARSSRSWRPFWSSWAARRAELLRPREMGCAGRATTTAFGDRTHQVSGCPGQSPAPVAASARPFAMPERTPGLPTVLWGLRRSFSDFGVKTPQYPYLIDETSRSMPWFCRCKRAPRGAPGNSRLRGARA
jgi:hypothetical protein